MAEAPGDDSRSSAPPDMPSDMSLGDATLDVAPLDARSRPLMPAMWARRWNRWRRQIVGALTMALVAIVAVGLFVRSTSDPAAAIARLLGAAPTTVTLLPTPVTSQDDGFAAADGVPWGVLTISGQRMPPADLVGSAFYLSPGAHPVEFQAADFPTLRCVVSVPRAASDTCPLANAHALSDTPQAYASVRLLDLRATPDRLSPSERAALYAMISQTLAADGATTTIAPGELYLDANGDTPRASAPLRYSITPEIASTSESLAHLNGLGATPCGPVCSSWVDLQSALTSASQTNWRLEVMVKPSRSVTDASGQSFTNEQSDARDIGPLTVLVVLTAAGWQVGPASAAQDITTQAQALFCPATLLEGLQGATTLAVTYLTLLPRNPADGCVIVVIQPGAGLGGVSTALLIDRFGVMQAADAAAGSDFPKLPFADSAAQAIAAQTAAESNGTGG